MALSEKPKKQLKFGGVAFFASVVSLGILGTTLPVLTLLTVSIESIQNYGLTILAIVTGWIFATYAISSKFSVFIHEFKHYFVSHLVGNKAKGMFIRRNHGHFEYQYYKSTAHHNSTIALAPYWLPIFAMPAIGIGYVFFHDSPQYWISFVSFFWGVDLSLGIRDIGPHQSDFTSLRGGYKAALIYLVGMHLTLTSFLLIWSGNQWVNLLKLVLPASLQIFGLRDSG